MVSLTFSVISVVLIAILAFLAGIPPVSFILKHYFELIHPVARQLKAADSISGLQSSFFVKAALDLGVFEALKASGSGLTVAELANNTASSLRGISALVDALAQDSYLYVNKKGLITNSATSLNHLVEGLPADQDMRPLFHMIASPHMTSLLSTSADAIRQGGSVYDETNTAETPGHPFWETFAEFTGPLGKHMCCYISTLMYAVYLYTHTLYTYDIY